MKKRGVMKRLKSVVNYVYRRESVFKKRWLGFTLIETMVAIPVALVVLFGVGATFFYSIGQFSNLLEQDAAQTSVLWAGYHTQVYFSQAVDVRFIANQERMDAWIADLKTGSGFEPRAETPTTPGIHGRIDKSFNSSLIPEDNKLSTIGIFYREDGTFEGGYGSSRLVGTAIWFKNPSFEGVRVNRPPYGGVLYFGSGLGSGTSTLGPRMDTIWYDRLSLFEIMAVECFKEPADDADADECDGGDPDDTRDYITGPDRIKTITFRIRARYFKTSDKSKWIWCSNTSVPSCTPEVSFKDIERIVKVGFRNNILVKEDDSFVGSGYDERLHGGLYFFKFSLPKLSL